MGYVPYQGATGLHLSYKRYSILSKDENKISHSTRIRLDYENIKKGNAYIGAGKITHINLSHTYSTNNLYFNIQLEKVISEFDEREEGITYRVNYIRDFLDKGLFYGIGYERESFLGRTPYQEIMLLLSKRVSKAMEISFGYFEIKDLATKEKLSELSFVLSLFARHARTNLSLYVDERGEANLNIKYQHIYPNGDELYITLGNPQALKTEPVIFMKYIKKIRLNL